MSNDKKNVPPKSKMRVFEWNSNSDKRISPTAQNNMSDPENKYNHITLPNNLRDGKVNQTLLAKINIINRGNNNLAPQMDLELGKRSITHKKIALGLADLVAGKELIFELKNPNEDGSITPDQQLELEIVEEWKKLGLQDSLSVLANGAVYFNSASMVCTQKNGVFNKKLKRIVSQPLWFDAKPNEQLRFTQSRMNEIGKFMVEYHAYHDTWGFTGDCELDDRTPHIDILPISDYANKSQSGKLYEVTAENPRQTAPAYYVKNLKAKGSNLEPFVSYAFDFGRGIFDNAYPLPEWKADSSINAIQSEFETSCIYTDYLRNGMHVFAIANVYSSQFKPTTENDSKENNLEAKFEANEAIQSLKKSHNSGTVVINYIFTDDLSKDGKIEIEKLELTFPVEATKFFNEEARASILTAWGVMADLFSVSKPEKNNLRSQGEFMKLGIVLLQDKVRGKQNGIEIGINEILEYYGITEVKARILPKENNAYMAVIKEFAAQYMEINEIRTEILGKSKLTDEQIKRIGEQKAWLMGQMQQQGIAFADPALNGDSDTDLLALEE